jgi:chromosomal replication initiation ATPase DnaA
MMSSPRQLVFDLPYREALEAEDFLVSASNAAAIELIDRWPDWPHPAAIVSGPEGSGKSHLANVWRLKVGAGLLHAPQVVDEAIANLGDMKRVVVEDVDRGLGDERALFHLLNLARENRMSVLLTARSAPGEIPIALPDLRSRLRALPHMAIDIPDEALLRAVLVKLFSDRQLDVEPQVISYLTLRMERSMKAATRIVAAADRLALALQRSVTRNVAAEALASLHDVDETE